MRERGHDQVDGFVEHRESSSRLRHTTTDKGCGIRCVDTENLKKNNKVFIMNIT